MSNFVKRLIPFESCDIPAIQSWLEDMAHRDYSMSIAAFSAPDLKGDSLKSSATDLISAMCHLERYPRKKRRYMSAARGVSWESSKTILSCHDRRPRCT